VRSRRELHRLRDRPLALQLVRSVALWQAASFFMLLSFIWFNEVLDLAHLLYDAPATPVDWFGACILSAAVVVVGFVSVAHTYTQQRRALDVFLVVCAHCRKVQVGEDTWTRLEELLTSRARTELSHGICPACYREATASEASDGAHPPRPEPPPGRPDRSPALVP
jgi:hypothetical protein